MKNQDRCYIFGVEFSGRDFFLRDSLRLPSHVNKNYSADKNVISATEKCKFCHQKCNIHHDFWLSFKTMTQTQT